MENRIFDLSGQVAIVTGCSTGLGVQMARALANAGASIAALARRKNLIDEVAAQITRDFGVKAIGVACDITDTDRVESAVAEVLANLGRIDILINNAGMGISGAFEFTQSKDAHRLMEVNLFGMNNLIRAVLPHMRAQRSGRIVNLSSVAGSLAIPFQSWYSISKAAVRAMTMALANEVHKYGVGVTCVQPGDIRTGFTAAREKSIVGDVEYEGRISKSVATMERDEQNGADPAVAGAYIAMIALKKSVKPEYTIGLMYKTFVVLARLLPVGFVRFVLEKMYG